VLASAVLVMSGFLTLLFIPLEFFTSIAVGGMLVVACVALATLTLLPAMIFLVGPNLEWGSALLRPLNRLKLAWPPFSTIGGVRGAPVPGSAFGRADHSGLSGDTPIALRSPRSRRKIFRRNRSRARVMKASRKSRRGLDDAGHHPRAASRRRIGWTGDGLAQEKNLVDRLAQLPNTEKVLTVTDNSGSRRAQQTRMGLLTSFNDLVAERDPDAQPHRSAIPHRPGLARPDHRAA
jgi:hypothetical protein